MKTVASNTTQPATNPKIRLLKYAAFLALFLVIVFALSFIDIGFTIKSLWQGLLNPS